MYFDHMLFTLNYSDMKSTFHICPYKARADVQLAEYM